MGSCLLPAWSREISRFPPDARCCFGAGKVLPVHQTKVHQTNRNSQTSPYLWLLTTLSAFPAILFWNHTALLMGFCVAFVYFYCQIYWSIVHFRSPKWLMRRIPLPASDVVENEAGRPG